MFKNQYFHFFRIHAYTRLVDAAAPEQGAGETNPDSSTASEERREYTQAQIDAIVEKRISRVRKEYADYEDMKAKAARLDEIEEANKSELQKVQEANETLQAKLDEQVHDNLVNAACLKYGIPAEYADLVTGSDAETIDTAAAKLAKLTDSAKKPTKEPTGTAGQHPQGDGTPSLDEQIRTAEAKGDWATSMRLKTLKLSSKH